MEDYKYGGSNITALRLIDPDNPKVRYIMNEIRKSIEVFTSSFHEEELSLGVSNSLATLVDNIEVDKQLLFSYARMKKSQKIGLKAVNKKGTSTKDAFCPVLMR